MLIAIYNFFRTIFLMRKLNKKLPKLTTLECGGKIRADKIDTDSNGNIILYHSLIDIPTQFRDFAYHRDTRFKLYLNNKIPLKLDLDATLEKNIYNVNQAYQYHIEMLTKSIETSVSFFHENVSCLVHIGTPRGNYGRYYCCKKGVSDEGNIISFYDPYDDKEHTFTAPFHYSTKNIEFLNGTFSEYWRDTSDCYCYY